MKKTHSWPVYGHDWAVDYLHRSIVKERVRHAYLITGPPSIGKRTLAQAFAMTLNCKHDDKAARPCGECRPCRLTRSGNFIDLLVAESDDSTSVLKIDAVREITHQIAMKPYEGRYKIAIFPDFQQAQPRAQDALLKTLEEPPAYAVLILLATSLESILPTITSRSQVIQLRPVTSDIIHNALMLNYKMMNEKAEMLARLSGGRIGWAIDAAQSEDMLEQREQALDLLESTLNMNRAERFDVAGKLGQDKPSLKTLLQLWQTYWRDVLLHTEKSEISTTNVDRQIKIEQLAYDVTAAQALTALKATQTMLDQLNTNVNARLALEVMFLDYPGLTRGR